MVQASSCETQPAPDRPITVGTSMARIGYHDVIRKNHRTYYMYNLGFGDSLVMFFDGFDFTMGFRHHHFSHQHFKGRFVFFPTTQPSKIEVSEPPVFFFKKKHPLFSLPRVLLPCQPNPNGPQSNKSGRRWTDEPWLTLGEKLGPDEVWPTP